MAANVFSFRTDAQDDTLYHHWLYIGQTRNVSPRQCQGSEHSQSGEDKLPVPSKQTAEGSTECRIAFFGVFVHDYSFQS